MINRKNKVLLFAGNFIENQTYDWLPNNILYLTAPLVEAGFEPILITEFTDPDYEDIIKEYAEDSIVFGVSAMSGRRITSGLKAARIFRECAPDTPIVWGGIHPHSLPEQTLEHELVDIVFLSPAENSFVQAVSAIKAGNDLQSIPGLLYKVDGKTVHTGRPTFYNLSDLPPFPYHILKIEKYINPKTRVLNYNASCGCPGVCSFCSIGIRDPWRALPTERILDDIEWLVKKYNLQTIYFNDADFFISKEHAFGISNGVKERNLNIYWRASSRVWDFLKYSREEMQMLEKSGLDLVFLGIEATTDRMQKVMRKRFKLEDVDTILQRAKGLSIEFYLSCIFGAPTETIEDLESTYNALKRWQSINANAKYQTSIFAPYPATALTALAVEHGLIEPKNLEEWGTFPLINDLRDTYNDRPWFSESFNMEYGKRFNELFPTYPAYTFKEVKSVNKLSKEKVI